MSNTTIAAPAAPARLELRAPRAGQAFSVLGSATLAGLGVELLLWLGLWGLLALDQVGAPLATLPYALACGLALGLSYGLAAGVARWSRGLALAVGTVAGPALLLAASGFALARLSSDAAPLGAVERVWTQLTSAASRPAWCTTAALWALTLGPILLVRARRPRLALEQGAALGAVGLGLLGATWAEGWDYAPYGLATYLWVLLGRAALFPLGLRGGEVAVQRVLRLIGQAAPPARQASRVVVAGGTLGSRRWSVLGALALTGLPAVVGLGAQRVGEGEPACLTPWRLAAERGWAWGQLGLALRIGRAPRPLGASPGLPNALAAFGVPAPTTGKLSIDDYRALLRAAAEQGHPRAMAYLAHALGISEPTDEALSWARRAARRGEPRGMYALGDLLERRGEAAEVRGLMERAAAAGDVLGRLRLADLQLAADEHQAASANLRLLWAQRHDPELQLFGIGVIAGPLESLYAEHPTWRDPADPLLRIEIYDADGQPVEGVAHLPGVLRIEGDAIVQPSFPVRAGLVVPGITLGLYHPTEYYVPERLSWARDQERLQAGITAGPAQGVTWRWQGERLVRVTAPTWAPDELGRLRGRVLGVVPGAAVEVGIREGNADDAHAAARWRWGHLAVTADAEGAFEVDALPPGRYMLRARVDGEWGALQGVELSGGEMLIGLRR